MDSEIGPERRSRLYVFPGGVFEIEESPDDEPGVGMYPDYHPPRSRLACDEVRAFGPGEWLTDDGPEVA